MEQDERLVSWVCPNTHGAVERIYSQGRSYDICPVCGQIVFVLSEDRIDYIPGNIASGFHAASNKAREDEIINEHEWNTIHLP